MMNMKVRQVLESIVRKVKEGDIPEAIAYSMFQIFRHQSGHSLTGPSCSFPKQRMPEASGNGKKWDGISRKGQKASRSLPHGM
jgi:hypothetical protein